MSSAINGVMYTIGGCILIFVVFAVFGMGRFVGIMPTTPTFERIIGMGTAFPAIIGLMLAPLMPILDGKMSKMILLYYLACFVVAGLMLFAIFGPEPKKEPKSNEQSLKSILGMTAGMLMVPMIFWAMGITAEYAP